MPTSPVPDDAASSAVASEASASVAQSAAVESESSASSSLRARRRVVVVAPRVVLRKLIVLVLATLALAPLIYYKLQVPAAIYVGVLVAIHVVVLVVYVYRTPWGDIWRDKGGLVLRVVALAFFGYLLTRVTFEGSAWTILRDIALALLLHAAIIGFLHVEVVEESTPRP